MYQIVVISWVKKRQWDFYECQWWVWKEPMIGDKSLSCGAVVATERHLDVCVTPRPCALLTTCTVCLLPHTGLYFRKTSCHQPLNMCLNDISPVCLWECLCPRDEYMLRGWIEITKMRRVRFRGAKCFLRIKLQRDKSWWATRFSFPPCVDDLLCPDSVVLTACLCSFCHTKATSSASAHNCLIPHNAKLELFALLQMNMGILRRVQFAILI